MLKLPCAPSKARGSSFRMGLAAVFGAKIASELDFDGRRPISI